MEKESYDDPEIGRLMNDAFVSIKVDREERPDIDNVYMNVSVMMTGSGGWPLNVIMTPDKRPFFVATYIPKDTRFGQTGLVELIPRVQNLWAMQHDKILNSANRITAALEQGAGNSSGEEMNASTLKAAYEQLARNFDENTAASALHKISGAA
jgi:uncharacterized protein YyaL (SSP411 family)